MAPSAARQSGSGAGAAGVQQKPGYKARRPRAARACELCRAKKNKCDEQYPCSYCRTKNVECVYSGPDMGWKRHTLDYVRRLEDQVKTLSATLELHDRQVTNAHTSYPESPLAISLPRPFADSPRSHDESRLHADDYRILMLPSASVPSRKTPGNEVSGVNRHTRNVEFYGSSSSIALLFQVQRTEGALPPVSSSLEADPCADGGAIVSSLHNPAFSPPATHQHSPPSENCASSAADSPGIGLSMGNPAKYRAFLNGFFSTIHHIHPILDKGYFMERCEALWAGDQSNEAAHKGSFVALYYGVLSLGALVGAREEEPIDGVSNLEWSRRFFDEAKAMANRLGMVTDLEMVQCYFFLAKVCQNEINPHLSYLYTGLAVRTSLAMGINREPGPNTQKDSVQLRSEARTWWGLYSLETEMAFAMGRPDTLGADLYHTRNFPQVQHIDTPMSTPSSTLDPPNCTIIQPMVDFSRITRSICHNIYLADTPLPKSVALAQQTETELEAWVDALPEAIRPARTLAEANSLRRARDAQWMKRQRLVLTIRYFNLRILLFGSFLLMSSLSERASIPRCSEFIQKCLEAAKRTIETIYQTYQHHDFFRTWFYNTTYTVFAASILLVYVTQEPPSPATSSTLDFVSMAIEILETMDECVVAVNAARMLQRVLQRVKTRCAEVMSSPMSAPDPAVMAAAAGVGDGDAEDAWHCKAATPTQSASESAEHLHKTLGILFVNSQNQKASLALPIPLRRTLSSIPSSTMSLSLLSELSKLLPLPEEELQQIVDYAATLPKLAAVEHFNNLLGDSPEALEFISTFNSQREGVSASKSSPAPGPSRSGEEGASDGIEPVPKSNRNRGKKKGKAALHTPEARRVEAVGPPPGVAYSKKDADLEYIPTSKKTQPEASKSQQQKSQPIVEAPKPTAPKKTQQGGFLISDHPAPKGKPKSNASSRSSTPKPGNTSTKISIVGGTPMKGASTALTDLDAAIRALEITTNPTLQNEDADSRRCNCVATRHPLQSAAPNCLSCGKVICMKEGLGPCTTCGTPLLSTDETEAILRELKAERGRERMAADRAAHKRADVSKAPAPFTQARDGFAGGSGTLSEAEAKAREHRDRLLGYQAQNARRTTVRDEVADFDVAAAMGGQLSMWSTPEERALELKKQQKLLREMEWDMKPEYEKRRQVVSIDLVGGKIVKKMAAVERPATPPEESRDDGGVLIESTGNRQTGNQGQGGAFSKNPLLGAMIKPVYNLKGKAKETEADPGPRSKWRRVQDDMDNNEGIILDGGVYGHSSSDAVVAEGDEPACG
ncbi:hypothetical protein jhhlp_007846 [Lomentospora prolificans]|uniref:Zn(2)-C6 fungal-type domain-containing protein n=1 Tax=Lomentospora prolificans TaxID=41688 RepID=A0A2N3N0S8_9PEZI|nr:hypothetical protein jhhlp_007846 [Lomentospora prolificans]